MSLPLPTDRRRRLAAALAALASGVVLAGAFEAPVASAASARGGAAATARTGPDDDDFGDEPRATARETRRAAPLIRSAGLYGSTGLLRTAAADAGPAGSLRFQAWSEFFRATRFLESGPYDGTRHAALRLGVSYAPLAWLEVFAQVASQRAESTRAVPQVEANTGDSILGVKACATIGPVCAGVELAVVLLGGGAPTGFDASSTSLRARGLLSLDVRSFAPHVPLLVHVNVGGYVDHSNAYLRPGYTQADRFLLRIAETNRFELSLGLEAPLERRVTAFLEWSLASPLSALPGSTGTSLSALPNILSAGARLSPWPWMSVLAAVDLGLTAAGQRGLPPIPPWQAYLALGFTLETRVPTAPAGSATVAPTPARR